VQCLVRLEVVEGGAPWRLLHAQEVLEENRFLAARDGARARLVDPERDARVDVRILIEELLIACEPHASALGCTKELGRVRALLDSPGAQRQREAAGDGGDHHRLLRSLVEAFLAE